MTPRRLLFPSSEDESSPQYNFSPLSSTGETSPFLSLKPNNVLSKTRRTRPCCPINKENVHSISDNNNNVVQQQPRLEEFGFRQNLRRQTFIDNNNNNAKYVVSKQLTSSSQKLTKLPVLKPINEVSRLSLFDEFDFDAGLNSSLTTIKTTFDKSKKSSTKKKQKRSPIITLPVSERLIAFENENSKDSGFFSQGTSDEFSSSFKTRVSDYEHDQMEISACSPSSPLLIKTFESVSSSDDEDDLIIVEPTHNAVVNKKKRLERSVSSTALTGKDELISKRRKTDDHSEDENGLNLNEHLIDGQSLRSHYMMPHTEQQVMESVDIGLQQHSYIADRTKSYLLPTLPFAKHADLPSITGDTVRNLLNNVYSSEIERFYIIDARYPYEYDGGHIITARNIYTNEGIIEHVLKTPRIPNDSNKRVIIIFHCEYSAERGPRLYRFLREQDRKLHMHCYPRLYYPECYLLDQGYKKFYTDHKDLCTPQSYRTMLDEQFQDQCRLYRSVSKQSEKTTDHRRTRLRQCLSFNQLL
ncbi:unnamed protein product [Didymodactylos carnosus]|uniref:M-phase inducer phosphatase n=1 Tax=Didymodactylos carnosus TaxID=1234261 RepID=A0A814NFH3_9BILA|nr:unnamed protein product [Didymodactylos carnosus]CAF1092127.1 unnamed protein product [Didymodactylos carnosus]CAF3628589.1 unnamed protein product [Didymodactylos carnosus]CAF3857601.1 unnamed protein product [Didymodactylos carnosus]